MTFAALGLAEPIVRAVAVEGYVNPTPIQLQAIPVVLSGRDLLGCAQTGTGKTAAFLLPILHRLAEQAGTRTAPRARGDKYHGGARSENRPRRTIRALILAPTRELASQIAESAAAYGRQAGVRHAAIFGGVNQFHQVRALQSGIDLLIATPGRLLDLIEQRHINLQSVEVLVLDEADRMLDMGFIPDVRRIVAQLPAHRQTLMFSATMPGDIRRLADSILRDPAEVKVNPVASTVELITQSVYYVTRKNKPELLERLLLNKGMERTLVFTRTKHGADRVVKGLIRAGIHAAAIHGNKSQGQRTRALASFKSTKPPVLVATDIASRGIDVDLVSHVINYDLPDVPETYVHRIGRTARAGASGTAITFCDQEENGQLRDIERVIRQRIDVRKDHADLAASAMPAVSDGPPARGPVNQDRRQDKSRAVGNGRGGRTGRSGIHRSGVSRDTRRQRSAAR